MQGVDFERKTARGEGWEMRLGDSVEELQSMPEASIDYSIFSPPFASLYTYSDSPRDLGNCQDHATFHEHFGYVAEGLARVIHCMPLPTTICRDGFIGLADFPGECIRVLEKAGFIYHSEVCIWKDPVTAMQRTKAIGLLYKQIKKDSTLSRQGIPDKLITMRRRGQNAVPVTHDEKTLPLAGDRARAMGQDERHSWQNYASPVWMDINPSKTLNGRMARDERDERHICPLQLEVIERAIELWSNRGETVLSPFGGIGSEGYQALKMGRKFIGVELKESYWTAACKNLNTATVEVAECEGLFADQAKARGK